MALSLYSDDNPKTTIKGFGYKNKQKAIDTIDLVEKTLDTIYEALSEGT